MYDSARYMFSKRVRVRDVGEWLNRQIQIH